MKTEELTALGLTEDQASKVFEMHGKELTKLQNSVTTLTTERDGFKTQLDTANTKLVGYDPEWKTKADTAQQDAQKQLDALKFNYALNDALKSAKVRDVVAVKAHLKTDALKLDGENILGLKEQLDTIKAESGFLFDTEEKPPIISSRTPGVQTVTTGNNDKANAAIREALGTTI
ncbi:phage scaffolding protein [Caproiciproducens faecalis]|uniref:Phage scaffolding protein n=1 Tax=Caproiciproducens faecalis TaxID=2820301 RepID=A0ABS7DRI6_9FIRM|nr:phage scaffolding protein [Caproiciproducens faecalis]MBW7573910.1 phage scaffolding protein [Caproiciproducens faecalis]